MSLVVRTAAVADAEAIRGLLTELHAFFGRPDRPMSVERRIRFGYFRDGEVGAGAPFLAVSNGTPVGLVTFAVFGAFGGRPSRALVQEFCVGERFRGRGVGPALVAQLRERAAARGCEFVQWGEDPEATSETLERAEMYCHPSLLGPDPDSEQERRKRLVRDISIESGWGAPTIVNRRYEKLTAELGDVLAEGEVPFAILSDGRVVYARFRTLWVEGYFTQDEETRWVLVLEGEPLRVIGRTLLDADSGWARGEQLPQRTRPHPGGGEVVRYEYFHGHHLGWTSGHLSYVFDPAALTVSVVEELTFESD